MMDWNLELTRLETLKQNEEKAKRLALVAEELAELKELEIEFQTVGAELSKCGRDLKEISDRNSPLIAGLAEQVNELKTTLRDLDVELHIQPLAIDRQNYAVIKQRTLVNELAVNKEKCELNFARWMLANQTLTQLEQGLKVEKRKLADLNDRFHELRALPDIANLDRQIAELRMETLEVQNRIPALEGIRRDITGRMRFLRQVINQTPEVVSV